MSGKYFISVQGGQVNVALDECVSQQDVQEMLAFKPEDVEYLLRTHSGIQSYWEALSIRLTSRYEHFLNIWTKKWWAHSNTYARVVLAAYGDAKPLVSVIQDMAVQIYSADTSETERKKYAGQAHEFSLKRSFIGSFSEYYAAMYRYQMVNPPWYFETVNETIAKLKEDSDLVRSVAAKLNDKSFHLNAYAKAFMPRFGNIGPMSVDDAAVMEAAGKYRRG